MNFEHYMLMRHEIVLTLIALILLVAEIFVSDEKKQKIIPAAIILFALATIVGFLPLASGILFGGMFQTTPMLSFMKNVLNMGVLIVLLQSHNWLKKEENREKTTEYFLLILSILIGMDFMISAGDFLMMYLGLELATIPMAALAAYDRNSSKSAEAGIKLILTSALSSGVLLFGISIIYGTTGSIYFNDIAGHVGTNSLQTLGFIFFVAGMAFKISLVPFHLWTADVYEGAPVNVTSFLAVVSKGASSFIFAIVLFRVFSQIVHLWEPLLYTLAVATMTIANLFAMRQDNLKRFLAFSSIAQAGYIVLGIMGASAMGMSSVIYFMLIYVFTNLAAFGIVSAIHTASGKENISDWNGLYKTNPKLSLLMLLSLFSLAGIPPVAGFFGKFFLFMSAASKGYYILILIAVLNATISLYYYLRVVRAMFIEKNEEPIGHVQTDWATRLSLIICLAGIVIVGFASVIQDYITSISIGM